MIEKTFENRLIKEIEGYSNKSYSVPQDPFFITGPYVIRSEKKAANLKDRMILNRVGKYYVMKTRFVTILKAVLLKNNFTHYKYLYEILSDEESKQELLNVVCMRVLGPQMVKLPIESASYQSHHDYINGCVTDKAAIHIPFFDWELNLYTFRFKEKDIRLYYTTMGIVTTFLAEQYASRFGAVCVEDNDVVLDCGGCWGDTAIYFATAAKNTSVYSFEFVPSNIKLWEKNIALNKADNVTLVPNPVSGVDGEKLQYIDKGPASIIGKNLGDGHPLTETVSIDEWAEKSGLSKIDFIKMDIEGAELSALKGSEKTLRKHRPKLAIAVYHEDQDFETIARYIDGLGLGYSFHLGHYTPFAGETVLFAKCRSL